MNLASKIVLIAFIGGLITTSCKKEMCKEPVPDMSFKEFYQVGDTGLFHLIFNFNDCDGDIGMDAGSSILDENGEVQNTNFKIDYFYRYNNQWVKHVFNGDGLNSTIPVLSNSKLNPILDGEVEKIMNIYAIELPTTEPTDTIMFEAQLLDNAGHYSNVAETPGFIITY